MKVGGFPEIMIGGTFENAYAVNQSLEYAIEVMPAGECRDELIALKMHIVYAMRDYKNRHEDFKEKTDEEVIGLLNYM